MSISRPVKNRVSCRASFTVILSNQLLFALPSRSRCATDASKCLLGTICTLPRTVSVITKSVSVCQTLHLKDNHTLETYFVTINSSSEPALETFPNPCPFIALRDCNPGIQNPGIGKAQIPGFRDWKKIRRKKLWLHTDSDTPQYSCHHAASCNCFLPFLAN